MKNGLYMGGQWEWRVCGGREGANKNDNRATVVNNIIKARRQWNDIFKVLKKTTKILYLAQKTPFNFFHFKTEGKIEILSDKQKLFLAKYLHNKKDQRSLFG